MRDHRLFYKISLPFFTKHFLVGGFNPEKYVVNLFHFPQVELHPKINL